MKVVKKIQITAIFMIILLLVQLMIPMMNISEAAIVISQDGQWNYEIIDYGEDSGKARLVNYNDTSVTTLTVPSQIDGIEVTEVSGAIGSNHKKLMGMTFSEGIKSISWISNLPSLEKVVLPGSLTLIDKSSFADCPKLSSILIPNNVTKIEDSCFMNCTSLKYIIIPSSVKSIGYRAFSGCTQLTGITLKEGVTSLNTDAFAGCTNLKELSIPSTLDSNSMYNAFSNCRNLESISVDSDNPNYTSENDVLFNKNKTHLILYPAGKKDTSYTIPDTVSIIDSFAFRYSANLQNINFNISVYNLGQYAFLECTGLNEITIKSNNTIGESCFSKCINLRKVIIEEGTLEIAQNAFWGCTSLSEVVIPNSTIGINRDLFDNLPNVFIKCNSGSYAEKYAKDEGVNYQLNNEQIMENVYYSDNNEPKRWSELTKLDSNYNVSCNSNKNGIIVGIKGNMTIKADGWVNNGNENHPSDAGQTQIEKIYTKNTTEEVTIKSIDGTKTKTITINVSGIDNKDPIVSITDIQTTTNSITVTAEAYDDYQLESSTQYGFYIKKDTQQDSEYIQKQNTTSKTCVINDLQPNTNYVIKVEVEDNVHNVGQTIRTIKTDVPDTIAPTCTITTQPNENPTNANSITYVFTFSEDVIGFTQDDIVVTNGTKGIFNGSGKIYTLVVTNSVNCTQTVSLDTNKCTDIAGNGNIATNKQIVIDRTAKINTNSYIIKNSYIEKISPNTTVRNIMNNISANLAYEIKNKDGIKLEETQIVATGCKMVFSSGEEYELVVKADLNGDGKVSITDLAKIKKQVVGNADLIGAYKEAADVNIDTKITATDLLQVKKSIVGLIIL